MVQIFSEHAHLNFSPLVHYYWTRVRTKNTLLHLTVFFPVIFRINRFFCYFSPGTNEEIFSEHIL